MVNIISYLHPVKINLTTLRNICSRIVTSNQVNFVIFLGCNHVQNRVTLIKQNFAFRKFQKMILCYFQENRSQSNDFKSQSRLLRWKSSLCQLKPMLRYITLYLSWFVFYWEWKSVRLELLTSIDQWQRRYKYTWAPQTVHNTPVMNILKGYFYIIFFYKKPTSNCKLQLNLSMHVGGTCRKWMDGQTARRTQSDDTRTWSIVIKQSHMTIFSSICQST